MKVRKHHGISPDLRALIKRLGWEDKYYLRCIHCDKPQRRQDTDRLLGGGDCICRGCDD